MAKKGLTAVQRADNLTRKRAGKKKGMQGISHKWEDGMLIRAYELARGGMSNTGIAKSLGVLYTTFRTWVAKMPALSEALKKARKEFNRREGGFERYCYGNLPKPAQALWSKIMGAGRVDALRINRRRYREGSDEEAAALEAARSRRVKKLLAGRGKRLKQILFLHALVNSHYSTTKACQVMNLPLPTVNRWIQSSPQFAQLVRGVLDCKRDFVEEALMKAIANGEVPAIIFASRTLNRQRGYNDKVEMEISNNVKVAFSFEDLDLPVDVQRKVLEAMRNAKKAPQLTHKQSEDDIIDAEFEEAQGE